LRNVYLSWYDLAMESLAQEVENIKEYKNVERVVILGMGGSGIAGDLVSLTAMETGSLFTAVIKDFYVPRNVVDGKTLVIAISYSGNTRETILSLEQCAKRTSMLAAVSSGGALAKYAREKRIPYVKVRGGLAPRTALPALYAATMKLLWSTGVEIAKKGDVENWISILRETRSADFDSSSLASFLKDAKLPLIVASQRYSVLAVRIKNELNENAKMPAKVEIAPELFHNDIVGWERKLFKDKAVVVESDVPYELEYLKLYTEILTDAGFEVVTFRLRGDSVVARTLYGSLVAGLASVRIAEILGIDPLSTKSISRYKDFVVNMEDELRKKLGL